MAWMLRAQVVAVTAESGIGNRKSSVLHSFSAIATSQKLLRAPWWTIPESPFPIPA
ncbi:hypothetical protein CFBP2533_33530 [Xanthomonas hortorum pv. pelargonii]|uniref:Uncharacterized protein n=1 Tax=Xanthomonas hortorum pv. pelargonii TaxID=453602 RepID=A0A6V7EAY4_9XANT|nr:hypothetical protein CFBP2533_33530 [Xanthomonas hortorum pv. pelargonii]CAD0348241.1 hypothetical protein CFBP2533_33530 [Xanthomonas hortorum pv. pelargonii]